MIANRHHSLKVDQDIVIFIAQQNNVTFWVEILATWLQGAQHLPGRLCMACKHLLRFPELLKALKEVTVTGTIQIKLFPKANSSHLPPNEDLCIIPIYCVKNKCHWEPANVSNYQIPLEVYLSKLQNKIITAFVLVNLFLFCIKFFSQLHCVKLQKLFFILSETV